MRITKINYGENFYQKDLSNTKNNELNNRYSAVQTQMVTMPNFGYGKDLVKILQLQEIIFYQ